MPILPNTHGRQLHCSLMMWVAGLLLIEFVIPEIIFRRLDSGHELREERRVCLWSQMGTHTMFERVRKVLQEFSFTLLRYNDSAKNTILLFLHNEFIDRISVSAPITLMYLVEGFGVRRSCECRSRNRFFDSSNLKSFFIFDFFSFKKNMSGKEMFQVAIHSMLSTQRLQETLLFHNRKKKVCGSFLNLCQKTSETCLIRFDDLRIIPIRNRYKFLIPVLLWLMSPTFVRRES